MRHGRAPGPDELNRAADDAVEMFPAERVAFILHDVFHYPFEEIGRIVGRSSAACRQLASSARNRVDGSSGIATPSPDQARLVTAFARAWEAQDVRALVGLLDPDATVVADGGGLVNAARRPIGGADRLARFLAQLGRKGEALGVELAEATVNGAARAHRPDGRRDSARAGVRREQGRIRNLWAMVNPEKLRPWNQPI